MGRLKAVCASLVLTLLIPSAGPCSEGAGGASPAGSDVLQPVKVDVSPVMYPAYGGKRVSVPGGAKAFADKVVSVTKGTGPVAKESSDPLSALGVPDSFYENDGGHYTLGCRGELVLGFPDPGIVEQDGPELIIFEVGDSKESARLFVSDTGSDWTYCGTTTGGIESVDISSYVPRGSTFKYLRIVDLGDKCMGPLPGVDIDAVAAPRAEPRPVSKKLPPGDSRKEDPKAQARPERIVLNGSILFDSGKAALGEEGKSVVERFAKELKSAGHKEILVEGYTDSSGSDAANLAISKKRAEAVADVLTEAGGFGKGMVKTVGRGKENPVADNATAEGRAKNRRVEIVVDPDGGTEN